MRFSIGLLILLSFVVSCKPQSSSTQMSAAPKLSGSCTIGKWTSLGSLPLDLKVSTDFSNSDISAIEGVAGEWNGAIPGKSFFTVPMNRIGTNSNVDVAIFRDNTLGIYKSANWFPDVSAQALAITQFYGYVRTDPSLGNYIDLTHADIIVNYRDYGTLLTSQIATSLPYDLPTIVIHEMGHFLGLCHETTHQSIMQPYYNTTQRVLMAYDKTKINDLYTNNYVTPIFAKSTANAFTAPTGTPIRGVIELRKNGRCMHYINGKLVYKH